MGRRLTTIAQGAFCLLLGLVASGIGHAPVVRARHEALARLARPQLRPDRSGARPAPVAARPGPAVAPRDATPVPAVPGGPPERTRVTLRSDDGAVWEVEYEVARGDALGAVAARFDVPLSRIMIANGIRNPHRIRAGARLRIPLALHALDHAIMAQLPPSLRENPERLRLAAYFDHWAHAYGIDPSLLKAIGWVESRWRYDVVSHRGAIGVGQLMPQTVKFVGHLIGENLDPWRPAQNIQMSARFFRYLLDETGDVDEALAAYYQGLGALRAQGMYSDTRPYVHNVQAARRYFTTS